MAEVRYIANAQPLKMVRTYTPANVNIGNTFTLTCNGKTVTYTAAAATVADVVTGLYNLLVDDDPEAPAEFSDVDWTDDATKLTGTSAVAGRPFTITSSASGGTATLTAATVTANSGPSDVSCVANYSGGALPSSLDTLILEHGSTDLLYNLDLSALANMTLVIEPSWTGNIGLPARNPAGYDEYRDTYLKIGVTIMSMAGTGGRVKIDAGSSALAVTVYDTGSGLENGLPACILKTSGAVTMYQYGGEVGIGVFAGENQGTSHLFIDDGEVTIGSSANTNALGAFVQKGGVINVYGTSGSSGTIYGGEFNNYLGTVSTLVNYGTVNHYAGNITSYTGGSASTITFLGLASRTIAAATLHAGATVSDPANRTAWSTGFTAARCRLGDLNVDFGVNRLYGVT